MLEFHKVYKRTDEMPTFRQWLEGIDDESRNKMWLIAMRDRPNIESAMYPARLVGYTPSRERIDWLNGFGSYASISESQLDTHWVNAVYDICPPYNRNVNNPYWDKLREADEQFAKDFKLFPNNINTIKHPADCNGFVSPTGDFYKCQYGGHTSLARLIAERIHGEFDCRDAEDYIMEDLKYLRLKETYVTVDMVDGDTITPAQTSVLNTLYKNFKETERALKRWFESRETLTEMYSSEQDKEQ